MAATPPNLEAVSAGSRLNSFLYSALSPDAKIRRGLYEGLGHIFFRVQGLGFGGLGIGFRGLRACRRRWDR